MYLNKKTNTSYSLPIIEEVPELFCLPGELEYCLPDLGFKKMNGTWLKVYTADSYQLTATITNIGFQYGVTLNPKSCSSPRTLVAPDEFALLMDISAIEMLCILAQWWKKTMPLKALPKELEPGLQYAQTLNKIKKDCPPLPSITLERDILRFYINKLKQDIAEKENNFIYLSIENGLLKIKHSDKCYVIPTIESTNIHNEIIKIHASEIRDHFPKRLEGKLINLQLSSDGLLGMKASWNGASLVDIEYPKKRSDYLTQRLMRRVLIA